MGIEIERKFLVTNSTFLDHADCVVRVRRLQQGYPKATGCTLRFQHVTHIWPSKEPEGRITVKSARPKLQRAEFEYSIPANDAAAMLKRFCAESRVWKLRADIRHDDSIWEVDVYEGEFAGLMIAELELDEQSETEIIAVPDWAGVELTYKPAYYNQRLAQNGWPGRHTTLVKDWDQVSNEADKCLQLLKAWT